MTTAYDYPADPASATDDRSSEDDGTGGGIHWATVLASAGAAAIVSALVVTIGAVGLLASERSAPAEATPATVVHLGAGAQTQSPGGAAPSTTPSASDGSGTPELPVAPGAVDVPGVTSSAAGTPVPTSATSPTATSPRTGGAAGSGGTLPANFRVTVDRPTLVDLNNIVRFLIATPASDTAKAANVEGGMAAVVVPRTVYTLGLFRAPLGWSNVTGPLVQNGNSVTATLNSGSAGRPTIRMTIEFKKIDGSWRLAASSLCQGVKTVGLNIYCNR